MKKQLSAIFLAVLFSLVGVGTLPQVYSASNAVLTTSINWPAFGFVPAGGRNNPYEGKVKPTNVSKLVLDWTGQTGTFIPTSPAVADGVVYIASGDGKLYAFQEGCSSGGGTCSPLWTATIGKAGDDSETASPTVANGIVYVGSYYSSTLYAFQVGCSSGGGTCSPLWTSSLPGVSTPTVANSVVYAGADNGVLYALDSTTGVIIWTGSVGDSIFNSTPAVANGVVYIGANNGTLAAFQVGCNSGGGSCTALWTAHTGGFLRDSPAVVNGVVYIGSGDGKFYAFQEGCSSGGGTCTPLWTSAVGGIQNSPAIANGVIYIVSNSSNLYALQVGCNSGGGTCSPLWTGNFNGSDSSPAVANGVVYVGGGSGLFAFRQLCSNPRRICKPRWTGQIGGTQFSSPAIANGVIYIGSSDGKLYAFHLPGTTP